ncbi:MAG TPA: hypothetical protein VKM55_04270 [Candidatus Lokiarchaeia archaeon]|nr:hypothetical protein [Candidatus Lokiarchaeia archaeon]
MPRRVILDSNPPELADLLLADDAREPLQIDRRDVLCGRLDWLLAFRRFVSVPLGPDRLTHY